MKGIGRDIPLLREVFSGDLEDLWMEYCRQMDTPMFTNMKKVFTSYLYLLDPKI
jgi:hypothetical protein